MSSLFAISVTNFKWSFLEKYPMEWVTNKWRMKHPICFGNRITVMMSENVMLQLSSSTQATTVDKIHYMLLTYCCIVTTNYTYTYTCRNIFNTIRTSGHSSLEKHTSHFIERILCERELETEQRLQHTEPPTLLAITAFLSHSPGLLNRGPGGPPSAGTWFSFQHFLSNWPELPVARVI